MLVLERKEGEAILLTHGETEIRIVFDHSQYGKTKVAIEAPQDVHIMREELLTPEA